MYIRHFENVKFDFIVFNILISSLYSHSVSPLDEDGLSSGPCYYLVEQEYAEVNEGENCYDLLKAICIHYQLTYNNVRQYKCFIE